MRPGHVVGNRTGSDPAAFELCGQSSGRQGAAQREAGFSRAESFVLRSKDERFCAALSDNCERHDMIRTQSCVSVYAFLHSRLKERCVVPIGSRRLCIRAGLWASPKSGSRLERRWRGGASVWATATHPHSATARCLRVTALVLNCTACRWEPNSKVKAYSSKALLLSTPASRGSLSTATVLRGTSACPALTAPKHKDIFNWPCPDQRPRSTSSHASTCSQAPAKRKNPAAAAPRWCRWNTRLDCTGAQFPGGATATCQQGSACPGSVCLMQAESAP